MNKYLLFVALLLLINSANAQLLKRLGDNFKHKAESKANEKINKKVDDVVDGKPKKAKEGEKAKNDNADITPEAGDESGTNTGGKSSTPDFQAYSKFDFVSGEKVVAYEDFSQDALGDFPDKWNTNSNGEIVTLAGKQGKWLNLGKDGVFLPEFINSLPENFTFEFDLACTPGFSYYSTWMNVDFAELKNPSKEFTQWKLYHGDSRNGIELGLHPKNAGGSQGMATYKMYDAGREAMKNETDQSQFYEQGKMYAHVSIWRQKRRLRMYVNETKVWDLPTAFDATKKYNSVLFMTGSFNNDKDKYFISNLRLAVGAPDTRNKLITEGRFVTSGILFDFQSANITPESYGILKEIGTALQENPAVKINITGHTSNDGDAAANLELSKKRAEAVKTFLGKNFSVDASRIATDGKGGTQPADQGTTAEAKANNRRVEFVKL